MTVPPDVLELADRLAPETERLRRLHPEVVEALVSAGLFRRLVPAEYGGEAAPMGSVLETIEAVSRADGSTGWCVMIANTTALCALRLPAGHARAIYGDPRGCTGGFAMPAGRARRVPGGLEVSGRWAWGSGTDHCTFIGGGVAVVDESGQPATTADGSATPFVLFEREQVELLDTWHVAGLRGTASTDYRVEGAFVPEGRWVDLFAGEAVVDSPAARFPFFGALAAGVAAVLIGLAERAAAELVALGGKRPAGSSRALAERAPVQAELALAVANVEQSKAWLHRVVEELWERAAGGEEPSDADRATLRLAATAAARRCLEAVDLCFHAAGGTAVYETSPLQRIFRDAHVAAAHGMIAPRTLEPVGRLRFGLPTSARLF